MSTTPTISHSLDDIEFQLAESADLSFVQDYGRVFRVFDDHDSGNISFGVDDGTRKRFIKVAGAKTVFAGVSPADAKAAQHNSVQVHRDIVHANIVNLIDFVQHGPYSALVFDWVDGVLLRRINEDDFARFRALPLDERLAAFDTVIAALQHVHTCGYVAVDVYDASFLYDFDRKNLTLIDLEVYERKPMTNSMGRMWGSTRFMSPEEFKLGAVIDEITNVYTLGAVAFLFFGEERVRMLDTWDAGEARFEVAERATSDDRGQRYASITEFAEAWHSS